MVKTVAGTSVGKLVESVVTRFVGMAMGIGWAIPKWCLQEIPELDCFSQPLHLHGARRFEQTLWKVIDNDNGECA